MAIGPDQAPAFVASRRSRGASSWHGEVRRRFQLHWKVQARSPLPRRLMPSTVLVYDRPHWFGVQEGFQPVQLQDTPDWSAEVCVVQE